MTTYTDPVSHPPTLGIHKETKQKLQSSIPLFRKNRLEQLAKDAPNSIRVFHDTSKHNSRAGCKHKSLPPLLIQRIAPRQHSGHGAGGNKQSNVLASVGCLDQNAPAAQEAAGANADAPVHLLAALDGCATGEAGSYARAAEADSVVEESDEGGEEAGRAARRDEGSAEGLVRRIPERKGECHGQVCSHGPPPGSKEAADSVVLARRARSHVHHLAGDGHNHCGISPGKRPLVVDAHPLQQG